MKCKDCGISYPFGLDLMLPDQQWNHIMPDDGLLCPTCICRRGKRLKGSTVLLAWIDNIDWEAPRPDEWFQQNATRKIKDLSHTIHFDDGMDDAPNLLVEDVVSGLQKIADENTDKLGSLSRGWACRQAIQLLRKGEDDNGKWSK